MLRYVLLFAALAAAVASARAVPRVPSNGLLTYQTCGGLFNQYAGIIDAIALGLLRQLTYLKMNRHSLGLTVLIGPLQTRYDMSATSDGIENAGAWAPIPFDTLFSYDALVKALPDIRIAPLTRDALQDCHTIGVPPGHLRSLTYFEERRELGVARGPPGAPLRLHLSCPEFTYAPHSPEEVILKRRIAGALRFNASLVADAEYIVSKLGDSTYSSFHFRCEVDAASTWHLSCADPALNSAPLHTCRVPTAPILYIATGSPQDIQYVDHAFKRVTKERYGNYLKKYNGALDVVAAIDALVLVRSRRFVGFDLSSFAYFVKALRLFAKTPSLAGLDVAPRELGIGGDSRLIRLGNDGTLGTFKLAFPLPE